MNLFKDTSQSFTDETLGLVKLRRQTNVHTTDKLRLKENGKFDQVRFSVINLVPCAA